MFGRSSLSKILYLGLSLLLLFANTPVQAESPGVSPFASSAVINVTTTNDSLNVICATVNPGDLSPPISLRDAICAANNTTAPDTINLPKGVYTLDLGSTGDDSNEQGDLDIKYSLTIVGAKGAPEPDGTVIENGYGNPNVKGDGDRIIHVLSDNDPEVKLEKVALRYADKSCGDPDCEGSASAIKFEGSGKLTVLDSLIYKNFSTCTGDNCHAGVMAVHLTDDGSDLLIQGTTIKLNSTDCQTDGCETGELLRNSGENSEATIKGSTIEHNSISCSWEDCKASELFEFDGTKNFTVENTTIFSNTLECEEASCQAAEIFDVHETDNVLFKDSKIEDNYIFANGDPIPGLEENKWSQAEEIIDANNVGEATFTNLEVLDNRIGCYGLECTVEEILRLSDGDTRTFKDVAVDGNKQECEGDGAPETSGEDYERACKVDQVLDLDEVTSIDIEDTTIQNNTQKCTGDAYEIPEPGCIVQQVYSSVGGNNDTHYLEKLRVVNNHSECTGIRCNMDEIMTIDDAEVYIVFSTIHNNSIKCKGRGCSQNDLIQFGGLSDVSINYSTISANTGLCDVTICDREIYGGINNEGLLSISNSTISGNQVGGSGGAILNRNGKTVNLNNVTIFGNKADADGNGVGEGGGICNDDAMEDPNFPGDSAYVGICTGELVDQNDPAVVKMSNTILAGNLDPTSNPDCYGTIDSLGHNLIQNVSAGCNIIGDNTGNIEAEDPALFPLADNGGNTWTHALAMDSPAVDAGENSTCEPDDQREYTRPLPEGGRCDIGAYELGPQIFQPIVFRD